MDTGERSLREAWQQSAAEWIRWARSPRLDHAFWRMNLPALMSLLPPPRGRTLDVACGEGRVARELKERGYEVQGIEGSQALADAAREADPDFEVTLGDAAAMPFPDAHFDLAVASLCLMNMDDMPAVLSEIARVLRPGGQLCLSVLHPINTWGKIGERRYFEVVGYSETIGAGEDRLTLHDTHRSLQAYFDALERAGFLIERLIEPRPDDAYLADVPAIAAWRERPAFLHVRAVLGTPAPLQPLWQPDPRYEPVPVSLRGLVHLVLTDLQGTKPIALQVGWDPDHTLGASGEGGEALPIPRLMFSEPGAPGSIGWSPEGPGGDIGIDREWGADFTLPELAVGLADHLQEQFFWESAGAWAEPRPECPGHQHPAVPALRDGDAWWVCPMGGADVARFGQLG